MKVVILAGGYGTRLAEETDAKPKALVEIGGHPIIWHIMKYYAEFGFTDFIIACGYEGKQIDRYCLHQLGPAQPGWTIRCVDTGLDTLTGGRLKRLAPLLESQTFMLTWSDGLANVDITALLEFHRRHGRLATVTAVHPPERFGCLWLQGDVVAGFEEKPKVTDRWVNGAFFILEPRALEYIPEHDTPWEKEPMSKLTQDGQMMAYRHESFWQCMDNIQEKRYLDDLWAQGAAPWKIWD